tara:strand:- start:73679 stop:73969 length:291 start_codon:yes stop_codon:yes gene_type:complete
MVYFKCPASATFFTTRRIGLEMIRAIGREDISSGFIAKEDISATLKTIHNKKIKATNQEVEFEKDSVNLSARLFPFIRMLEDANKATEFVYWVEEL